MSAVIHFAARKQVGESVARPAWYYQQNIGGLANMLLAMEGAGDVGPLRAVRQARAQVGFCTMVYRYRIKGGAGGLYQCEGVPGDPSGAAACGCGAEAAVCDKIGRAHV